MCRITLLRLKPYMFEPDEEGETGMRVKQPLASFLGKFRQARMLSQLPISELAAPMLSMHLVVSHFHVVLWDADCDQWIG